MHSAKIAFVGGLAVVLSGACNRPADEARDSVPVTRSADETARAQRDRQEQISKLEKRVADVERKYSETNQKVESGKRTATSGLREELHEDVTNVKRAVNDLKTTTPENWWEREEQAMKHTADDVEADVRRLAGKIPPAARSDTTVGTSGESVSTAPFTSRRDRFVAELRMRVDAMERALDDVKARGPQETELDDTRARVKKLREDLDTLRAASPNDWWKVTNERVAESLDRVERSVGRLDDNKRG